MEVFQDGATEILEHIESLRRSKFSNLSKNYGVDETDRLEYTFSILNNEITLSILTEEKQEICHAKAYLVGEVINGTEKKYTFVKNNKLDSVLKTINPDEVIDKIVNYKISMDDNPYFISVILGAYIIAYDFDYIFTINGNVWGVKDTIWKQQIIGDNLTDIN